MSAADAYRLRQAERLFHEFELDQGRKPRNGFELVPWVQRHRKRLEARGVFGPDGKVVPLPASEEATS